MSDRLRWNARYLEGFAASFAAHPLAVAALAMELPDGPVADLACGPSGSALYAASAGRAVTAVDVSDVALGMLRDEAVRRGLGRLIRIVEADLADWQPEPDRYSLVLCTGYWERDVFEPAARAVAPGGLLAWEALTEGALRSRPGLNPDWCLRPGEPASLLPAGFAVAAQGDVEDAAKRRLLARRIR